MHPGPRDDLVTRRLAEALASLDPSLIDRAPLDGAEAPARLSRHLAMVIERALRELGDDAEAQAALVNDLVAARAATVDRAAEIVETPPAAPARATPAARAARRCSDGHPSADGAAVEQRSARERRGPAEHRQRASAGAGVGRLRRPAVRLRDLERRRAAAGRARRRDRARRSRPRDHDDVHGRDAAARGRRARRLGARGARRVRRADDEAAREGVAARTRVRPDARRSSARRTSRIPRCSTGSSGTCGSRRVDARHVIERVRSMFESYWASEHFEPYDPATDGERLDRALGAHRDRDAGASVSFIGLDVHPYPHQQRMLERLMVERERHGRHRNLVVAATGTGKTVVAALDYRQLRAARRRDLSLLFVAHRERILEQSRATFRAVLRDGSFGEIHGGGRVAGGSPRVRDDPVGLRGGRRRARPQDFDVVIVDEFHHAAAPSYRRLLDRLEPRRAARADGDAGADGRAGRDRVLRRADRRRASAVGGDRRGLSRPVPVLRRRRRNRSLEPALAARRLRAGGAGPRRHRRRRRASPSCSKRFGASSPSPTGCARSASACRSSMPSTWRERFTDGRARRRVALSGRDARERARARAARARSRRAARDVLGRRARRGCRRPERGHGAAAAADGQRDGVHAAARARPAPGRRQAVPDGDRPDRPAAPPVPLRSAARRARRSPPRSARRADRGRLPVPPVGMPRRARPSERGDRARATCATPRG